MINLISIKIYNHRITDSILTINSGISVCNKESKTLRRGIGTLFTLIVTKLMFSGISFKVYYLIYMSFIPDWYWLYSNPVKHSNVSPGPPVLFSAFGISDIFFDFLLSIQFTVVQLTLLYAFS